MTNLGLGGGGRFSRGRGRRLVLGLLLGVGFEEPLAAERFEVVFHPGSGGREQAIGGRPEAAFSPETG